MSTSHWAKHIIIGGACATVAYKLAEHAIVRSNASEETQKRYLLAALGASSGGALGYFLGEQRCELMGECYSRNRKLVSTALGSVGGGLLGYAVSNGLVDKISASAGGSSID